MQEKIQHNSEHVPAPFEANGRANWGQRLKIGMVHLFTSLPPTQRQLVALCQVMCTHQWSDFSPFHSFGIFPCCPLACLSLLLCLTFPFSKPGLSSSPLTSSLNYHMSIGTQANATHPVAWRANCLVSLTPVSTQEISDDQCVVAEVHFPTAALKVLCWALLAGKVLITHQGFGWCWAGLGTASALSLWHSSPHHSALPKGLGFGKILGGDTARTVDPN